MRKARISLTLELTTNACSSQKVRWGRHCRPLDAKATRSVRSSECHGTVTSCGPWHEATRMFAASLIYRSSETSRLMNCNDCSHRQTEQTDLRIGFCGYAQSVLRNCLGAAM